MSVIAGFSLSIFRSCPTRRGQVRYSGIGVWESSGNLIGTGQSALFRDVGRDTSTRRFSLFTTPVVSSGRLWLTRRDGDRFGRAEEALGRKPSGLCPKPEASAERSCRTALRSGTAVERRTNPCASNQTLMPPPRLGRGGGSCPGPVAGHFLCLIKCHRLPYRHAPWPFLNYP